jgi:ABC-2 type transport system permease protein
MNKILAVMRREVSARVRTKAFIISTILLPLFIAAVTILPAVFSRSGNRSSHIAIVDASSDTLGIGVESALQRQMLTGDSSTVSRYRVARVAVVPANVAHVRDTLIAHVGVNAAKDGQSLDGVLVINDSTLATGKLDYFGDNTSALEAMGELEGSVTQVLTATRLAQAGVSPAVMVAAMKRADLSTVRVNNGKTTGQSGTESFFIAYAMGFLLYFTMIIYGQQTLTSVIEEKSSRIMEVLASSLRPFEMLLGKILGVGLTGLLQLSIWAGAVVVLSAGRVQIARVLGVSAAAMQQLPIPTMPTDLLVVFLLYFVLGFLLYGALYAAIGSMFNTVQEAQQVAAFVQMVILVGFFALFAVIRDPTGSLGVNLSLVPFFSPFIMPARWSLTTVPVAQLATSIVLSVLAILAVAWIAGRIYRTGILMYGKKPSLMDVTRWIRAK